MPSLFPYFLDAAGPVAFILLFCVLHLLLSPLVPPRPPALWYLAERAGEELVRRLHKPRSARELFFRGTLLPLVMAGLGLLIGLAAVNLAQHPFGWVATLALLFACVSPLAPVKLLQKVARAAGPVDRAAVAVLLRPLLRDRFDHTDEHALARRGLETAATHLNLFFVMPVLWFIVGGAPLLMVTVMLSAVAVAAESAADGSHGQPFVRSVRAVASIFEAIPAWITGLLIILAATFVSRSWPLRALRVAVTQTGQCRPRRQGMPIAALAGALGVTLGGPRRHENGHTIAQGWIGPKDSSARIPVADLQRAALIGMVVFLVITALLALAVSGPIEFSVINDIL